MSIIYPVSYTHLDVYKRQELPEIMPGVNPGVVTALDCPAAFLRAEQEMEFVEKNRLSCLTWKDDAYPARLRECEDAPIVLFFKGNTDFNRLHVVDMVGTRRATDYGKDVYKRQTENRTLVAEDSGFPLRHLPADGCIRAA